VLGSLGIQT